jgi:hypothetical protein
MPIRADQTNFLVAVYIFLIGHDISFRSHQRSYVFNATFSGHKHSGGYRNKSETPKLPDLQMIQTYTAIVSFGTRQAEGLTTIDSIPDQVQYIPLEPLAPLQFQCYFYDAPNFV